MHNLHILWYARTEYFQITHIVTDYQCQVILPCLGKVTKILYKYCLSSSIKEKTKQECDISFLQNIYFYLDKTT